MAEYLGRTGYAGGYRVVVEEDRIRVIKDGVVVADQTAPPEAGRSPGRFAREAADLHVGWARLPTGDEIVAIFDGRSPRHGFVVNLTDPALGGRGDIPATTTSPPAGDPHLERP